VRSLGPIWAIALTLDRDLALLFLGANLLFAVALAAIVFRGRQVLDRVLITLGAFLLLTVLSTVALHFFARTPVREVDVFAVD
jgi:hypothetical protein